MIKKMIVWSALSLVVMNSVAAPLSLVSVGAPGINCFFSPNCSVSGNDYVTYFTIPGTTGSGFLQSRTYTGQSGTPGAGREAFQYRIDTSAITSTSGAAIHALTLNALVPPFAIDYTGSGTPSDTWKVTSGGLGSIGPSSVVFMTNTITFYFNPPIQCGTGGTSGQSSYFFGFCTTNVLATSTAHMSVTVGAGPVFNVNSGATTSW